MTHSNPRADLPELAAWFSADLHCHQTCTSRTMISNFASSLAAHRRTCTDWMNYHWNSSQTLRMLMLLSCCWHFWLDATVVALLASTTRASSQQQAGYSWGYWGLLEPCSCLSQVAWRSSPTLYWVALGYLYLDSLAMRHFSETASEYRTFGFSREACSARITS